MEYGIILKAYFRRHKGSLAGVFLLMMLISTALGTVLSVWTNSAAYIRKELDRAGFGTLTLWVSGTEDMEEVSAGIGALREVEKTETQPVIFSDYTTGGQESDSEGQLIPYNPQESRYRFFTDDFSGYLTETPVIASGEVYVSPSMVSMFGVGIGDEIRFPIARAGRDTVFIIKGFYEDPFMGSSMIGMKGFLICETDWTAVSDMIQKSGIDALARQGAMIHVFADDTVGVTVSGLNSAINESMNENGNRSAVTEFVHSRDAIAGFMMILQNAFSGLLTAFALALLFVVMVVLAHSISSIIEAEYVNMGILKAVGFTGEKLRVIQLILYLTGILGGMALGLGAAVPLSRLVSDVTVTTTGIRIPVSLPVGLCVFCCGGILLLLSGFVWIRSGKINRILPMQVIRGQLTESVYREEMDAWHRLRIKKRNLYLRLALRQLMTGRRRYMGACATAALLVFFASMAGRMDSWLGRDGRGMMEAFNPADHDIGVQVLGELTAAEAENTIRAYSGITDSYLLAMPNVTVEGIDYTANVISDPERFHILEGSTCLTDGEVVVTEFVAADLGLSIGDRIMLTGDSGSGEYAVSGFYSCANDMGDNIGMSREGYLKIGKDIPQIWCHHYFLADSSTVKTITEVLEHAYGGDIHVHENTWPGLSGIISAMGALLVFLYVMTAVFIMIVTLMTGNRVLSVERKDMGIYKAIGFTDQNQRMGFALRFGMTAFAGAVIGISLAAVLTDPLVSTVMRSAGISNFASHPSVGNILMPAVTVIVLFAGFAYAAAGKGKKEDLPLVRCPKE